jgi:DNA-binding MarR family transcriptional regulator
MDNKKKVRIAETVARECIAGRVRLLSRVITGIYDRAMRLHGIKLNQASILIRLSLEDRPSPSDIGKRFQMDKSTVSRNLDRMRKQGWIEIHKREDGIQQFIKVTPKGNKLLVDIYDGWKKAQKEVGDLLGEKGVDAVHLLVDLMSSSEARK